MRPAAARYLPVALAFALVAGCGSRIVWDAGQVQATIRTLLTKQAGVQVKSVSCPSKVKIATGVVTYCTATLTNGDTVRFAATQRDSNGHVHVGPAEMIALEVQNRVEGALRARGIKTTASCPQHVPIVVGKTFVCKATDPQGTTVRIGVTINSPNAGFSMKILGS